MNYDAVVVGAGFTGAALAYQFAKDGKKVLVLEKRAHIAGNLIMKQQQRYCRC